MPQIVGHLLGKDQAAHRVELAFTQRLEQGHLEDIASAVGGHLELAGLLDLFPLVTVDVRQQSLALVHGGPRHLRWPVEDGVVPLRQSLLASLLVVALARDVLFVVTQLVEGIALLDPVADSLSRLVRDNPILKFLVEVGFLFCDNLSLRHFVECG